MDVPVLADDLFAIIYLVLYPGFGNNKGLYGWSSAHGENSQYAREMEKAEETYGPIFAKYQTQDLKAVAADPEANAMGGRLFLTYCAQCHGSDARGAKGFPNLTDNDWLYGGEPDTIKTTIIGGRMGVMPALGAALGGEGTRTWRTMCARFPALPMIRFGPSAARIFSLRTARRAMARTAREITPSERQSDRQDMALRLLGVDHRGDGNQGRQNQMPAFQEFLGDAKVHLLAAYVYSLSNKAEAAK